MSKNETNRITTPGAVASRSKSTHKVLDSERRFIDDLFQVAVFSSTTIVVVLTVDSIAGFLSGYGDHNEK